LYFLPHAAIKKTNHRRELSKLNVGILRSFFVNDSQIPLDLNIVCSNLFTVPMYLVTDSIIDTGIFKSNTYFTPENSICYFKSNRIANLKVNSKILSYAYLLYALGPAMMRRGSPLAPTV